MQHNFLGPEARADALGDRTDKYIKVEEGKGSMTRNAGIPSCTRAQSVSGDVSEQPFRELQVVISTHSPFPLISLSGCSEHDTNFTKEAH